MNINIHKQPLTSYLQKTFAKVLEIEPNRLIPHWKFSKFGLDSVASLKILELLDKEFSDLPQTLLFEIESLEGLVDWLLEEKSVKVHSLFSKDILTTEPVEDKAPRLSRRMRSEGRTADSVENLEVSAPEKESGQQDVAIIGLSGRYPQSHSVEIFWENLKQKKDLIGTIPASRWNKDFQFSEDKSKEGFIHSKYGGFLNQVEYFEPLFFQMSPREAVITDPQERIFLETTWNLLESCGYTRQKIQKKYKGHVSLFVGVMSSPYKSIPTEEFAQSALSVSSYYTIANRASWFFNFKGASAAIDTACSSSLTALSMACNTLINNESELAIAGGVNLSLDPKKYLGLSMGKMIGTHLNSRSFGDGDGYIPSEGSGAVLLKTLAYALRDKDPILAVIKGIRVSHSGHTQSFGVPQPKELSENMNANFLKSNISPSSISFVESSANGSPIGDSVDFQSLCKVFGDLPIQSLPISSVKANVGHGESVSGMAQLSKIIYQLKEKQLTPQWECAVPNQNLDWSNSPFKMQKTLEDLPKGNTPLRASLNSFGAGGTQVHVILEEAPKLLQTKIEEEESLLVLSAKTPHALVQKIKDLAEYIKECSLEISSLIYTLQEGREEMECRVSFLYNKGKNLHLLLTALWSRLINEKEDFFHSNQVRDISDSMGIPCFYGHLLFQNQVHQNLLFGEAGSAMSQVLLQHREWNKLLYFWVQGGSINWSLLYKENVPLMMTLPTYPFQKKAYWLPKNEYEYHRPKNIDNSFHLEAPKELSIKEMISYLLAQELKVDPVDIIPTRPFEDYGVDSLFVTKIQQVLKDNFDVRITGRDMLEYGNINSLVQLAERRIKSISEPISPKAPIKNQIPGNYTPLSEVQKGIWLLQKLTPAMSAFNIPISIRIKGAFDKIQFKKACGELLSRHPILLSKFLEKDGEPRQDIPTPKSISEKLERSNHIFYDEDVSLRSKDEQLETLKQYSKQTMSLHDGSLFKAAFFHASQEETFVQLLIHHIVFDGSSGAIFSKELFELIQGNSLPPQNSNYQKFIEWEQNFLSSDAGEKELKYWKNIYSGTLPVLQLPRKKNAPITPTFSGETKVLFIDDLTSRQIRNFAKEQQINLSVLFLSGYHFLLYQFSGQRDLIIGMPSMGRPKLEFKDVIGCFINMVALRNDVNGSLSVCEFLQQIKLSLIDSLDHGNYPFRKLTQSLKIDRNQSTSTLYQAFFAFQNYEQVPVVLGENQEIEFISEIAQEGDNEFALEVFEDKNLFKLKLKYNPDIFEGFLISQMMEQFPFIVSQFVNNPNAKLSKIFPLPRGQWKEDVKSFNNQDKDIPSNNLLHHLFVDQVKRNPESIAVAFQESRLTYEELDVQSTKLAFHLLNKGIQSEQLVGLCMERSLDMVVGLVGILKSGGVFVPFDPGLPKERMAYMLKDSGVELMLSKSLWEKDLVAFGLDLILMDSYRDQFQKISKKKLSLKISPQQLAYIIYTSGSTGKPKGVMIEHYSTSHHCLAMRDYYKIDKKTTVAQFAPMSFDAAIEQIFAPLSIGAKVQLSDVKTLEPKRVTQFLKKTSINVIQIPPALQLELFKYWKAQPDQFPKSLRTLISCGDVMAVESAHIWKNNFSKNLRLLNIYGPTEITGKATIQELDPQRDLDSFEKIPIGKPLYNKRIYLLNQDEHPVPQGVIGEIFIGGIGPGRGYFNKEELTNERFKTDPFKSKISNIYNSEKAPRMYQTGDLGRINSKGELEFLGRSDYQVKIRGYRIELGEIESQLRAHPHVSQCAVVVKDKKSDRQLRAFITPAQSDDLVEVQIIKDHLTENLPDYMIPLHITGLKEMPLTTTGKINRLVLQDYEIGESDHNVYQAPVTYMEKRMAVIWGEILEKKKISREDNFFDLGGHSLLGVRLVSQVESKIEVPMNLSLIFAKPCFKDLCAELENSKDIKQNHGGHSLVPLNTHGSKSPIFALPGAGGTAFYFKDLSIGLSSDQPFYGLQSPGLDGKSEPIKELPDLAKHFLEEIKSIQPEGPYKFLGHSFGGRVALEMAFQLEDLGEKVEEIFILDSTAPGQLKSDKSKWDESSWLIAFAHAAAKNMGQEIQLDYGKLFAAEVDEKLIYLYNQMIFHELVAMKIGIAAFKGLFNVFKENNTMSYSPKGKITSNIIVFKAGDYHPEEEGHDEEIVSSHPEAASKMKKMSELWTQYNKELSSVRKDDSLGWKSWTHGKIQTYLVPGTHMGLVLSPHSRHIANHMLNHLSKNKLELTTDCMF